MGSHLSSPKQNKTRYPSRGDFWAGNSKYNQGNWAEKFGFVVQIMLTSCGPDIFNSKDRKALKLTCKATRLAVHPLFRSLDIRPENAISLEHFISACHGTALLPWNPSHVRFISVDAGNVPLRTLQTFTELPMPNLVTLKVSNASQPTLFAAGDWPQLTSLELSFSKEVENATAKGDHQVINTNQKPAWPLAVLKLAFKDEGGARQDFPLLLSNILATYSHPKTLQLDITSLNYISVIPSLAAASLPLLEELEILGSADNLMNQIAMAKHWPNIRHLSLDFPRLDVFKGLNLQYCPWFKKLEILDLCGYVQLTSEIVASLMESLHGGRLQGLHINFNTKDFSEFRVLRSGYLPDLTWLTLVALNEPDTLFAYGNSINDLMDAIFNAKFPSLKILDIEFPPESGGVENYPWSEAPSVPAKTAFPKLEVFELADCSIRGDNVHQYLKDLNDAGCTLNFHCSVNAEKVVELSPEQVDLMDGLGLNLDELDEWLFEKKIWHDFWCWGLSNEEMDVLMVAVALSKLRVNVDTQVPVHPLKKVVAMLEGAEEGSYMEELATNHADWIEAAKKVLQGIDELQRIEEGIDELERIEELQRANTL